VGADARDSGSDLHPRGDAAEDREERLMLQRTKSLRAWNLVVGSGIAIFLVFPLLWLVRTAFTPESKLFAFHFSLLPSHFTLSNFSFALGQSNLGTYLLNSIICAGGGALIATALATYAAYGLVSFEIPFARGLMSVFLLAQIFPAALLLIKLYSIFVSVGLTDNRFGLALAYVTLSLPAALYIMHSFLLKLPGELIEAARIDGAGEFRIFHSVVLPLIRPALVSVFLFSFMWGWNDLLFSLTLVSSDSLKTLGPGLLSTYLGQFRDDWGGIMAASILSSLPVVVLFMLFQRTFVRGVMAGAVKG
jgi:multiple sugar transport system permease protein